MIDLKYCDTATKSTMVFDELDNTTTAADYCNVPSSAPISPCTSEESDDSIAAIASITGRFSDIEDKYYLDSRVLGTGHHGSVRQCTDRATGQRYAVKTLVKSDLSIKAGALVREIMLLQEMKHHSIIQLVDLFEDFEQIHLVTDLCSGGELFEKIIEKSQTNNGMPCFTEEEAAKVLFQILTSVSYMHKNDVVHRDLKPENILFETEDIDSHIRIIDFGLARKHRSWEPPMTTVVGTPYYIAPEVLHRRYDESCDLWSVGVIAYILLCGYPPFNGKDGHETHASVLRGQYRFHYQDWKFTSRESRDFIRRLLQMDPRKRMTVEQALNHPWIMRYAGTLSTSVESRDDISSEEFAVKKVRLPRKCSILSGRLTKQKMRLPVLGSRK